MYGASRRTPHFFVGANIRYNQSHSCVWRSIALKTKALLLCLLALLLLGGVAMAQSSDPENANPVILTDAQGEYPLGLHLDLLEDPGGQLSIEDVTSPAVWGKISAQPICGAEFGFTNSAIWVRLELHNDTQQTDHWLLEQGFANTHYVDLYTPLPDGQGYSVRQTGVLRPVTTRDITFPNESFSIWMCRPASEQTYYLRFQSGASMTLPLTLWTAGSFYRDRAGRTDFSMGIFYGVLIALFFYNLFLLLSLREANYLYLMVFLVAIMLEESFYDGYLGLFVIPGYSALVGGVFTHLLSWL